ncbi:MAG: 2'-5' RNA ligase family protein [Austwickia sp.]|jgi:2'-5' RNA ligase|nr:2'-5' RNA ligase family protein [Austwickia sp.]MBK8436753.1 2'-5' RNA ligase family protein [Austwickia sp.]
MRTIGVAVGLPEPYATFIQDARRAAGDPEADRIRTHITLLPPTPVVETAADKIADHLAAVAARHCCFDLEVGEVGTFRPVSPVQFLRVLEGAGQCRQLEADVRSGPLARDLTFPYHPHVTLAQQVSHDALDGIGRALADYRLRFTVESFQLYHQDDDGGWRPVQVFPLTGGAEATAAAGCAG